MDIWIIEAETGVGEWQVTGITNHERSAREVVRHIKAQGMLALAVRYPAGVRISDSGCRKIAEFVASRSLPFGATHVVAVAPVE